MIQTGIESRVKIQDVISSQLPNFILDESPKTADFLKQYYISQEFQSGVVDIAENLDQYLDFDNLTPEKLFNDTTLSVGIGTQEVNSISVSNTKGFPNQYGLLRIDNEILTYTGLTTNTFTGLTRGFSGITSYHDELNEEELIFSKTNAGVHTAGTSIQNLSSLFLDEFYKKIKYTFAPGFENLNFDKNLNIGNFLKEVKSFYETKGTDDAIKILFRVLYGVDPKIINLEDLLFKPSAAEYLRRETVIVEVLSGNPIGLVGQTIKKIEKLNDPTTQASVSEVEPFTRQGKQYYKFSLFIGYGGASLVEGNFKITSSSKSVESISIGSSVLTVDSTIGFPSSGTVLSGINTISYSEKTINQFLGCAGITSSISPSDSVFSDEIYFGFEDGDLTKKVEFRITGILSKFKQKSENIKVSEGDIITIKNLGDKVLNPTIKNRKEIFANSWIYNTSSFIEIDAYDGSSTFILKKPIDRSIFKVGDQVEFVDQSRPDEVIYPTATDPQPYVKDIFGSTITIEGLPSNGFQGTTLKRIRTNSNIRRKLNKAKSISAIVNNNPLPPVPIKYDITSDVTNVYFDDDSGYAASNSLPSAKNSSTPNAPFFEDINFSLNKVTFKDFQDLNQTTQKFKTIQIDEQGKNIKLITGDKVFYQSSGLTFNSVGVGQTAQIVGIDTGAYFIEIVDENTSKIRLYSSRSFIPSGTALELDFPKDNEGNVISETHTFTLYSQRSNLISPAKSLKKFPLKPSLKDGGVDVTLPGTIGKMINGVEIFNYKTDDKIYYGPLSNLSVLSGGSGYDVINPPKIDIEEGVGTGATAVVSVKGKVVDAFIDPQDFDIDKVVSIGITGGNGSGAVLEPIIGTRSRQIVFEAVPFTSSNGFGVDSTEKSLTFKTRHNLNSGDRVIYSSNRQVSIGQIAGTFVPNHEYFVSVVNDKTVRFYESQTVAAAAKDKTDAIGIAVTAGGIQRLIVGSVNNTILGVNVLSGGEGYENRKLSVQPSNISTIFNKINFNNHNFKDGDKIVYEHDGTTITGLSTVPNQQYLVTRIDSDSFKLSDAGIGGTSLVNFNQKIFTNFESTGIGTQIFKYPDIVATVEYLGIGSFGTELVNANITPVVKGEISDVYLLKKGSGYGSSILNFENSPIIKIKNGTDGSTPEIKPIINSITGGISTVSIGNSGTNYFSTPVIEVIDSLGIGNGAKLRVVMNKQNGELTGSIDHVEVISAGIGYSETTTSIRVIPSGVNGLISANVRVLNVNNNLKYGDSLSRLEEHEGIFQNVVCGFDRIPFKDEGFTASKIVGWAYDGNPIYGSYGYVDPEKKTNNIKLLKSGYRVDNNAIIDRPVGFGTGFFIEDFVFDGSGDLDEFNGRFEINDDYPNGVYAYHATGIITSGSFAPAFPYFIGDKYRSKFEKDNLIINQSFDFFNSSLRRNTFPYNVTENNAGNDFISEANAIRSQQIEIETVESGSVNDVEIIEDGTNQKVGDVFNFNNTGTNGDGLIVKVESIKGESINSITSFSLSYNQSAITKKDNNTLKITTPDSHDLTNGDLVVISGLTSSLSHVNGSYIIGISSIVSSAISPIISNAGAATTEIYTDIATDVKVGDKIRAGNETLTVLNTYDQPNIITVQRGNTGLSHTATTPIYVIPDSFTIKKSANNFNSTVNQKVFFNPIKSVGFVGAAATAGRSREIVFTFGETRITRTIPAKGIYLENHPFATNQKLKVITDGNPIGVSDTAAGTISAMPTTVFAVRKNKNVIGIKKTIDGDEVFLHSSISGSAVANKDTYAFESVFVQEKVNVKSNKNMVTLDSRFHQLKDDDFIDLNVITKTSTGIGTLSEVIVKRDPLKDSLILDPVSCETSGITTSLPPVGVQTGANVITLDNHNFTTGQKVNLISSIIPVGLGNSDYFVNVVDDRTFSLCDSFENATANPPIVVGILSATQSGIHTFTKINPRIFVEKDNDLVFNLSDSSLSGYKFKVYYDKEFKNEFVSTGSSQGFNTPVGIITEGETGSKFTIGYGKSVPDKLYYNIEKLGVAVTADNTVRHYSEIEYVKNNYNGTFKISNVGINTFTFSSVNESFRTVTDKTNCKELSYSTTSGIVTGAINSVNIVSGGSNYKKLPTFVSIGTTTVNDVSVLVKSSNVGNIKKTRVINEGFEYPSDPTLQPEALLPKFIQLRGSKAISRVDVVNGGANYITPPKLIVVDTETGVPFSDSLLTAELTAPKLTPGSSILSVNIEKSPSGISVGNVGIFAIDNTNGVSIQKVNSTAGTSTFDIFITTPALGYTVNPFKTGDTVFIEGLQKVGVAGSGFNSSDYGYKLLSVSNYVDSGTLHKVTIDVSQYTSNTGVAVTDVGGFADIINSNVYPSFKLNLVEAGFRIGEKIIIDDIERDLTVVGSGENFVKLQGLYELSAGDILFGSISRNRAKATDVFNNQGQFEVNYSLIKDLGWETNVGKLNEDIQVLPNNDYYQNLAYSIQSPIEWDDLKSPVNNLVHTSGFKNFADTGISSSSSAFPIRGSAKITTFLDVLPTFAETVRVDTIYNFDRARDIFVGTGSTDLNIGQRSKFIQLKTVSLTDFIQAKTNNVLNIDDISSRYSNLNSDPNSFLDVIQVQPADGLNRVLALVKNRDNTQTQIAELIILNNNTGSYLLERSKLSSESDFTKFELKTASGKNFLRFTPSDQFKFNVDYDIKRIETKFNTTLTGTGTSSFGFANITGSVVNVGGTTSSITTPIISTHESDALFIKTQVTDTVTNEMNYIEHLVGRDATNTFLTEAYFDSNQGTFSSNILASFSPSLSGVGNSILSFNVTNSRLNPIRVRSNIIGFGTITAGIGTYRFLASGQGDGSERTQLVESKFDQKTGISTIATLDKTKFIALKATAHVATATSEALHQVYVTHNGTEIFTSQSEYLSGVNGLQQNNNANSPLGIGTFHAKFVGDNFVLEFIPDNTNGMKTVRSLNEVFYSFTDEKSQSGFVNHPNSLVFGALTQSSDISFYNALNGDRINRRNFELTNNNTPIFAKTFDPSDTSIVNIGSGKTFTIKDHFFRTNEELIYTPQASFVGVGTTAMVYKIGAGSTAFLPSRVFAIRENDDKFSISITKGGDAVTLVDAGEGNNHQFEMAKGLSKSLITIDGLVQHPIAQTDLVHQLVGNISAASSIFRLSGISSINLEDIIKIDDEYIRVTNVGLGTNIVGPIGIATDIPATIPLIQGQRGYVGSSAATHSNSSNVNIFKGSYNIVGKEIHFTEAPRGNNSIDVDESNLPPARSDFEGRVYLRNDYSTNRIYDDISNKFTGITSSFELKSGGSAASGIGTIGGNGILFINNIFQRPSTDNNSRGNFKIIESVTSGVTTTTVLFSGITTVADGSLITSDTDINQNELPRGGVIVSLGSTGGLGYAPLVPAKVKPQVNAGGTITSIVGVGYSGAVNAASSASYDNETGEMEIFTTNKHFLRVGYDDEVILSGFTFNPSISLINPISNDKFSVIGITSEKAFKVKLGISTISHTVSGGTVRPWYGDLTFGSGYNIGVTTNGVSVAATVFDPGYNHDFVSAATNAISVTGGSNFTPTDATYDPVTGDLVLFISGAGIQTHGLTESNTVSIATSSISFTCSKDNYLTIHPYPRPTDPVAGIATAITSYNSDTITVNVGSNVGSGAQVTTTIGTGGVLSFNVVSGGSNYKEPEIFVPSPSYDNMKIEGVSRVGFGTGPDTGIGALISASGVTTTGVANFELSRNGYNFRKGDKFTPVGLVTDKSLSSAETFVLEVREVYQDNFSSWQFGEFDYIDSIAPLQDGSRTVFPLLYNGELLSIIVDPDSDVIAQNILLIFVNGVLQRPGDNYQFDGGTLLSFTTAPSREDDVAIYVYRGTSGVDTVISTDINKTLEEGDDVQIVRSPGISTSISQDERTVFQLTSKDRFETNLYTGQGIDDINFKPLNVYKQKVDKIINGRIVPKTRDSIEPQIYPTAKVISSIASNSAQIYVDNADFFNYEDEGSPDFRVKLIPNTTLPTVGSLTATISNGQVNAISIASSGSNYTSAPTISISAPPSIGVGVGTTATATVTVGSGGINGFTITNAGFGYTVAPSVLVKPPVSEKEIIRVQAVTGFSATITRIIVGGSGSTTITFKVTKNDGTNFSGLSSGDYIFINNTTYGNGVTSLTQTGNSNVGVGTTSFDNVYQVSAVNNVSGANADVVCKATVTAPDNSLDTGALPNVGTLSFGKLSSLNRSSSPLTVTISGFTVNSGLSTFPSIQRSSGDYTLRNTGALPKTP